MGGEAIASRGAQPGEAGLASPHRPALRPSQADRLFSPFYLTGRVAVHRFTYTICYKICYKFCML